MIGGLLLTGLLHLVASLAVIATAGFWSREGPILVFGFWAYLGLLQWVYLLPAGLVMRRFRPRAARGIWVGGVAGVAFTALLWVANAAGPIQERLTGNTPDNQLNGGTWAEVVRADASSCDVRDTEGTITYQLVADTKYLYLGPRWQQQPAPAGWGQLGPGTYAKVYWVLRDHTRVAREVIIWTGSDPP